MDYATTGTHGLLSRRIAEELDREKLKNKLCSIFPGISCSVCYEICDEFFKMTDNLKITSSFIIRYSKGEIDKIINLDDYFAQKEICVDDRQRKKLYKLLQQLIINKFTIVQCMKYIDKTFPLWSELKRLLLKQRRDTNMKQWEFIASKRSVSEGFEEHFMNAVDYKILNNEYTAEALTKLVNMSIRNAEFENTLCQESACKGWFPFGFDNAPEQHEVSVDVLFKLAYSFRLTPDEFEKLCTGSVKGTNDPSSYKYNMFLFGLKYDMDYAAAKELADVNNNDSTDQGVNILKKYCDNYAAISDYIALTEKIRSTTPLEETRAEVASEAMKQLLDKTNMENIARYFCDNEFISTDTLIEELYPEHVVEQQKEMLEDTSYAFFELEISERYKCKTLSLLCDGSHFKRNGLASKALTPPLIRRISERSSNIFREHILRIGYLSTLIDFINDAVSNERIIKRFEEITNPMLNKCCYHPLFISFPLDALMYLSLSSHPMCIPEVYQIFLPKSSK